MLPQAHSSYLNYARRNRVLGLCFIAIALFLLSIVKSRADIDPSLLIALDKGTLKAGEFVWFDDPDRDGSVVIVVSLGQQLLYVYRSGTLIAVSTISSGKKGHATPTGTFEILQRERMHHSNKYDDAPMPFMLRLTWDGVAMHGGNLPGYRASHGCIRLPLAFSRELYEVAPSVISVIVMDEPVVEGIFDGPRRRQAIEDRTLRSGVAW